MNPTSTPPPGFGRRAFLARSGIVVVGGGLWLAGCGSSDSSTGSSPGSDGSASTGTTFGGAPTDIRFQLSWVKDSAYAGYYVADADGMYSDAGIGMDFLGSGPQGPYPEQVLAGGGAEIGSASGFTFVATAVKAGTDLVVIGAQTQENPACLVSLPDNPVGSLSEMVGKKVGTDPSYEALLKGLMAGAGVEPDIEVVPVGSDASALLAGDCDVLVGFITNQPIDLEMQGIDPVVVMFGEIGFPGYAGVVTTTRSYLDANRDAVVRFMRATIAGWETVIADPSEGVQATVEDYGADLGLDPEKEQLVLEANIGLMESPLTETKGLFYLDPSEVAGPVYAGMATLGLTDLPDPTTYIDLTVLDDAYQGATTVIGT